MKILVVSDEEESCFWDYYRPGRLAEYDLILAAGDLKAEYLSFLVTMARCPLMYIHGNHDGRYEKKPPEGCNCIEDKLIIYRGVRILGLGGCRKYKGDTHQYTDAQMRRRIRKLWPALKLAGGVDIVLTHAPARYCGDAEDLCHRGFESFVDLMDQYRPQYFVHGHIHLNYGKDLSRVRQRGSTTIVNACGHYVIEIENDERLPQSRLARYARKKLRLR
ncbi:MAG: metallophosphoesterase [Oscillospiraceae bacterium]|nr:metallophosphoesterase [Oscillospiraceae bacterium]